MAASASAQAPGIPEDLQGRVSLAGELNELSGVKQGLAKWKEMLLSQDPTAGSETKETEKFKAAWRDAVEKQFDAVAIDGGMRSAIANELTKEELTHALTFEKSKLGRRLTAAALKSASTPKKANPVRELQRQIRLLDQAAKRLARRPQRAAVIAELVEETDALNAQVETTMGISRGTAVGSLAVQPKGRPRVTGPELDALLELQRIQVIKAFSATMSATFEQIYASISTKDLASYVAWLKTPMAHKITATRNKAFIDSISTVSEKIGANFTKAIDAVDI
jgi:hypothetical protein